MHKQLQIHVLENIQNGRGWHWSGQTIVGNDQALRKFENSGYDEEEYFACTIMLIESGKVVAFRYRQTQTNRNPLARPRSEYEPRCLTVEGLQYLADTKHPRQEWAKRNWFAVTVAIFTFSATAAGIAVNALIKSTE